jgi:hypothetical protein
MCGHKAFLDDSPKFGAQAGRGEKKRAIADV